MLFCMLVFTHHIFDIRPNTRDFECILISFLKTLVKGLTPKSHHCYTRVIQSEKKNL